MWVGAGGEGLHRASCHASGGEHVSRRARGRAWGRPEGEGEGGKVTELGAHLLKQSGCAWRGVLAAPNWGLLSTCSYSSTPVPSTAVCGFSPGHALCPLESQSPTTLRSVVANTLIPSDGEPACDQAEECWHLCSGQLDMSSACTPQGHQPRVFDHREVGDLWAMPP